ncbi:MAG TPA: hypothetical protein DEU87_00980 [Staphylococcus sp.]|nr:hypothetical protein [Staphylococcus sp.]
MFKFWLDNRNKK